MKLLLCLDCDDIFNLGYELKTCSCGTTKGKYTDERQFIVVSMLFHWELQMIALEKLLEINKKLFL